jgi:error-prone DNA polymerase
LVVVNDAYYHVAGRRPLQDVLTCVRHGCTIAEAGFRLFPNGERYLKPVEELARLWSDHPRALARTMEIAERASSFSVNQLRYEYAEETCPPGVTPMQHLKALTWEGAKGRYPNGIPDKVRRQIEHEFALIAELNYAPYFLTVHDLVAFARSRGILCQGRGAAANSAVCYCLGVTSVDPDRIDVLFERFVSRERNEPPDIDIDFEHERREEVIQYLYNKYGRDRAGLTAEVITYRRRSAIRDVGKALGFSLDAVDRIAKRVDRWEKNPFTDSESGDVPAQLDALGFDSSDATIRLFVQLVRELLGFPRHLSQHVGGFVITRGPLSELVPIENAAMPHRTVIEWDKDDIDALGMLKVDVLGLGMPTCIRKGLELIEQHHGRSFTLATIPSEDPAVYDMLCRADSLGVFQVESRAQMTMLPRLQPRCFYDLVIEVAIVRPGPIVGDMVHPYLRRRNGEEPVHYPDETIRQVLGKTLGVPLFQEQVMALAIQAAGFTPGEAEKLRRAITAWTSKSDIAEFPTRFVGGMMRNGYPREFAEWCFQRFKGFSQYGFPESHAASFALLVYASAWIKCYYPAVFAAALLNSQPLGFYAPAQIVRDAQEHGVVVRPVDVNHSGWDCTLEDGGGVLRLGLRMTNGLRRGDADAIVEAWRRFGPFISVFDLWRASEVSASSLRVLAQADAFRSMGLDRQHSLWEVRKLYGKPLPLFDGVPECRNGAVKLPTVPLADEVSRDYCSVGLSLKAHPVSFLRPMLKARRVITAAEAKDERVSPFGCVVAVAGIVLFRQRPGTAKGVMFMTIEDETGRLDLIVRPDVYERFRDAAVYAKLVIARGRVERRDGVVHLLSLAFENIERLSERLPRMSRDFR